MCHKTTTVVVKKLGEKHDQKVLDWVAGQGLDPGFTVHSQPVPPCYILQGDNYDTTVHAQDMRMDNQNKSLHYFNTYAVKDRPDFYKLDSDHKATLLLKISKVLQHQPFCLPWRIARKSEITMLCLWQES